MNKPDRIIYNKRFICLLVCGLFAAHSWDQKASESDQSISLFDSSAPLRRVRSSEMWFRHIHSVALQPGTETDIVWVYVMNHEIVHDSQIGRKSMWFAKLHIEK